jgi:hypothetical protein
LSTELFLKEKEYIFRLKNNNENSDYEENDDNENNINRKWWPFSE